MVVPLTKGTQWAEISWNEEAQKDFETIKNSLCGEPVLFTPDFNKPIFLETDTSRVALRAVLTQKVGEDNRPVAYASCRHLGYEVCYAKLERECVAIKWGVELFKSYLMGHEFTLITGHTPLKWLQTSKTDNARIMRWALVLQPYRFTIKY